MAKKIQIFIHLCFLSVINNAYKNCLYKLALTSGCLPSQTNLYSNKILLNSSLDIRYFHPKINLSLIDFSSPFSSHLPVI